MSGQYFDHLAKLADYKPDPVIADKYERHEFGYGWADADSDGQDERAEVLIDFHRPGRRGVALVLDGERVVSGRWMCRFSRRWFTDAAALDVDHVVPLREVWISGGSAWDRDRRRNYANGRGIRSKRRSWLLPVDASLNRSKGARGPAEWLPPADRYCLNYAALWVGTKKYWGLSVTADERAALEVALRKIEV